MRPHRDNGNAVREKLFGVYAEHTHFARARSSRGEVFRRTARSAQSVASNLLVRGPPGRSLATAANRAPTSWRWVPPQAEARGSGDGSHCRVASGYWPCASDRRSGSRLESSRSPRQQANNVSTGLAFVRSLCVCLRSLFCAKSGVPRMRRACMAKVKGRGWHIKSRGSSSQK